MPKVATTVEFAKEDIRNLILEAAKTEMTRQGVKTVGSSSIDILADEDDPADLSAIVRFSGIGK